MKIIVSALFAVIVFLGLIPVSSVQAEPVIKRISCKNTNPSERLRIYTNDSGNDVLVTYQVVRDGCRPKDRAEGGHRIRRISSSGTGVASVFRTGKMTEARTFFMESGWVFEIYFESILGSRVSGTFDYVLTVHN